MLLLQRICIPLYKYFCVCVCVCLRLFEPTAAGKLDFDLEIMLQQIEFNSLIEPSWKKTEYRSARFRAKVALHAPIFF